MGNGNRGQLYPPHQLDLDGPQSSLEHLYSAYRG
jgi:hypothetical protein